MAFENNSFLADLHEKWYNSTSVELLGLGSGGGGHNKRMKTSNSSPAKWLDVLSCHFSSRGNFTRQL
jgi:hypothetical protein